MSLSNDAAERLIALGSAAIAAGFARAPAAPDPSDWPAALLEPRATFVTLTTPDAGLRGCRGTLEAARPLGADVWWNAAASAFDDPRFAPVVPEEFAQLHIEVSVLSALERLDVEDEAALRARLVPRRDGLVLTFGRHRATFLPKVWETLPEVEEFLGELKRKAGLPRGFWSASMRVERYFTENIGGQVRR
jgi:AmmeMemoRadiSam system protein A